MLTAELTRDCGLFPTAVAELSIRCVDDDLFCWVLSSDRSHERLIALSGKHEEAQCQLASTLEAEHGFDAATALIAAQTLFADVFRGTQSFPGKSRSAEPDWRMAI